MTNDEAIKMLKLIKSTVYLGNRKFMDAIDMAIEALSCSEIPNNSDKVYRQAAIDALKHCQTYLFDSRDDDKKISLEDAEYAIEQLPSAQPEREIVRCKDCKYWTHIKRTNRYWCKTDDGLYDLNPSPDDFCSRAERRKR